jgi:hypothetical protein
MAAHPSHSAGFRQVPVDLAELYFPPSWKSFVQDSRPVPPDLNGAAMKHVHLWRTKLTLKALASLLRQSKGDRGEVDYARFIGIKRSSLHRIEYEYDEIILRRLDCCRCVGANFECLHRPRGGRPEASE